MDKDGNLDNLVTHRGDPNYLIFVEPGPFPLGNLFEIQGTTMRVAVGNLNAATRLKIAENLIPTAWRMAT